MALVKTINLSKSFGSSNGDGKLVVDNLNLQIDEGELVTLFGPNGCGKSTVLNLIAGILKPDTGEIFYDHGSFELSSVGYVFQNHADSLLPWRTVKSNIAFPLEIRNINPSDIVERVNRKINQFHLDEHADKYIYQLSGGLKQLVAIARATVYDPQLLLLDEPFSALDYSLSRMFWVRFREFWMNQNVSTLFVSHNIDEAIFLGDKICVLSARPAEVVAEISIPFGKKRNLDILTSTEFFNVRSKVLEVFEKGRSI